MTPEEAAVVAERQKQRWMVAGAAGGMAGFAGIVFWLLNASNEMRRSVDRRKKPLEPDS